MPSVKLKIEEQKTNSGIRYLVDCPRKKHKVSLSLCKKCEYCRMAIGDNVSCSYDYDIDKKDVKVCSW